VATITIHTGVPTSPKHRPLSDGAFRLWTHALCWSKEHLTDGFIPSAMLEALHPRGAKFCGELLATLVPGKGPLWHAVEGGYAIHDYGEWQDCKDKVQDRRRQWREKKARQRGDSPGVSPGDTKGDTKGESLGESREGVGSGSGRGVKTPPTPTGECPLFGAFWSAYPRHVGKAAALKAFARLKVTPSLLQLMINALAWQRQQDGWTKDGGVFVPHPATWLNQRRWEDERPGGHVPATTTSAPPAVVRHGDGTADVPVLDEQTGQWSMRRMRVPQTLTPVVS
jgi:hypothetical protein